MLQAHGYTAYVVGGAVRDLMLGVQPKDFDVATDAHPEEMHRLFRRSRMIGRRFKLVHVVFGDETVEVSTFRSPRPAEVDEEPAACCATTCSATANRTPRGATSPSTRCTTTRPPRRCSTTTAASPT